MKNKKLSWFLLPVVLAIWGIIGWKVYAAMKQEPEEESVFADHSDLIGDTSFVPEDYELILDYRDPFLGKTEVKKPKTNSIAVIPPQPPVKSTAETDVWPVITYSGLVREPKSGKTVGFLTIAGESCFVQTGDILGDLSVGKCNKDSVQVLKGKVSKWIKR